MKTHGSVGAVVAAIEDEVQVEIERLEAETNAELLRLGREFDAHPPALADRDRRLAIAHALARERVAREDYQDAHSEIAVREAWMRKVIAAGHARLGRTTDACRRAVLARLADEALAKIPARECVVQLRREDGPLADAEWVRDRTVNGGKTNVEIVAMELDGGCIAVSVDGRVAFDNSIAARIERFEAQWRSALATIFEEARK